MKQTRMIFSTALFAVASVAAIAAGCAALRRNALRDGVFTGTGAGRNGPIEVSVVVEGGKIVDASIISEQETESIGVPVERPILDQFIRNGGVTGAIDVVSGATITCNAMFEALDNALGSARGKSRRRAAYSDGETDIVIIGAGGAGLTAATEAASRGAGVIVLEKMGFVGGNTNSATGGLNASETAEQRRLGIKDSNEQFFEDTMRGGHYKNDEALVRTLVENSARTVEWLQGDLVGADLSDVGIMGGSTNRRTHRPSGGQAVGGHLVPKLHGAAKKAGAEIRLNSTVTDIIEENGKAAGVRVHDFAGDYTIRAKAVIIATGGFGANPQMIGKYRPDLENFPTTNTPGATGDAFGWVQKFGVALSLMDEIQTHPSVVPGKGLLITEAVRGNGAIMVSHQGKRFVNELDTRDVTSRAILALPEKRAYILFNDDVRKSLKAIEDYAKAGLLTEGKTVEDISARLGMDASVLGATLDDYNAAQAGLKADTFGRADMARPLSEGAYYAVEIEPAIHHTMGGIKINSAAQVLRGDGSAVPGLYAAGEVTGGVHGDNRLGGNAVADIAVFGKIAADSALEYIGG